MISTLVLKVAAPCNLACTYCYEYKSGDESWKAMPKHIDIRTVEKLGERIREYALSKGLTRLEVMLHGGEPLLLGPTKFSKVVTALRECAAPVDVRIGLQTNAVLVTNQFVDLFREHQIRVGVSLDGDALQNRNRVDLSGQPSFERALAGYRRIQAGCPELLTGILTVIDLANSPRETIRFLCSLKPRQLDLLLPFVTHEGLGSERGVWASSLDDWLKAAFNEWFYNSANNIVKIRIFEDVMQAVLTRRAKTDWFGPRRLSYLVVATNGHIDTLDHLKVIGVDSARFRGTEANVFDHTLAESEEFADQMLGRFGATQLPNACKECELSDVCAGGYLPHRYSAASLFDNPSVACIAIKGLFSRSLPIVKTAIHTPISTEVPSNPCL